MRAGDGAGCAKVICRTTCYTGSGAGGATATIAVCCGKSPRRLRAKVGRRGAPRCAGGRTGTTVCSGGSFCVCGGVSPTDFCSPILGKRIFIRATTRATCGAADRRNSGSVAVTAISVFTTTISGVRAPLLGRATNFCSGGRTRFAPSSRRSAAAQVTCLTGKSRRTEATAGGAGSETRVSRALCRATGGVSGKNSSSRRVSGRKARETCSICVIFTSDFAYADAHAERCYAGTGSGATYTLSVNSGRVPARATLSSGSAGSVSSATAFATSTAVCGAVLGTGERSRATLTAITTSCPTLSTTSGGSQATPATTEKAARTWSQVHFFTTLPSTKTILLTFCPA